MSCIKYVWRDVLIASCIFIKKTHTTCFYVWVKVKLTFAKKQHISNNYNIIKTMFVMQNKFVSCIVFRARYYEINVSCKLKLVVADDI